MLARFQDFGETIPGKVNYVYWWLWGSFVLAEDPAQLLLKSVYEPLAAQGATRALVTAHQGGLLFVDAKGDAALPVADLVKHGMDSDQGDVLSLKVRAHCSTGNRRVSPPARP